MKTLGVKFGNILFMVGYNVPYQILLDQILMLSFHTLQHLLLNDQQILLQSQSVIHKILLLVYSKMKKHSYLISTVATS